MFGPDKALTKHEPYSGFGATSKVELLFDFLGQVQCRLVSATKVSRLNLPLLSLFGLALHLILLLQIHLTPI